MKPLTSVAASALALHTTRMETTRRLRSCLRHVMDQCLQYSGSSVATKLRRPRIQVSMVATASKRPLASLLVPELLQQQHTNISMCSATRCLEKAIHDKSSARTSFACMQTHMPNNLAGVPPRCRWRQRSSSALASRAQRAAA